jgi:peroxiredoxin
VSGVNVAASLGKFVLLVALLAAQACGASASSSANSKNQVEGQVLEYSFPSIDGETISSPDQRGRVTVLLFVTTFDVLSQSQAQRLEDLYRTYSPRINALAIVMEAPRYVELARSFRDVVGLNYPVAIADRQQIARQGMLSQIQQVPAWIVLDANGRVSGAAIGEISPQELKLAIRRAE